jgi:stearoyl-CoA desaturase (delta-9 desaturase)
VTRTAIVLFVVTTLVRMFAVTAGYHRYFSHRSYRLARAPQFVLAFLGLTAAQKGPLWWASHHRDHHRYSDTELDPHSPQRGFYWSHIGWVMSGRYSTTDLDAIDDFAKFPELRFLNRFDFIGPWALGTLCFLIGGWSGLVFGFFLSTVLLWHCTFCVNSAAHLIGRRRYATTDTSRNSLFVAAITMGEGWHNNHHHYPACARQGFRWYELDPTYYLLRLLALVHVVHDLREPPASARKARRLRDGNVDIGMIRFHLARAGAVVGPRSPVPEPVAGEVEQLLDAAADTIGGIARRNRIGAGSKGHASAEDGGLDDVDTPGDAEAALAATASTPS